MKLSIVLPSVILVLLTLMVVPSEILVFWARPHAAIQILMPPVVAEDLDDDSNYVVPLMPPPPSSPKNPRTYWTREKLEEVTLREARKFGLDEKIVLNLVTAESSWVYWVHGCMYMKCSESLKRDPARGLWEIRCSTARDLGFPKWRRCYELQKDPVASSFFGAKFFRQTLDEFGNYELAVVAYYIGPTRLRRILRGTIIPKVGLTRQVSVYMHRVHGIADYKL